MCRCSYLSTSMANHEEQPVIPELDASIQGREGFGLIQVFTGNGKGKTTAALGEAMRAASVGKRVGIVFFDKGGDHYSERLLLDTIPNIEYIATGRDRIDAVTGRFDFSVVELDKTEARRGLDVVEAFLTAEYDLVIADELNSCVSLNMLTVEEVLATIEQKPPQTELVLTGRNAPEALVQKAHLVTEMRLIKHYFYSGVPAREGLDY